MDLQTIKKINRDSVAAARAAEASAKASGSAAVNVPGLPRASAGLDASVHVDVDQQHLLALAAAAVVGLVVYVLLRTYKPNFVTRQVGEVRELDQTRLIISAVIAALVVLLAYYLYTKQ